MPMKDNWIDDVDLSDHFALAVALRRAIPCPPAHIITYHVDRFNGQYKVIQRLTTQSAKQATEEFFTDTPFGNIRFIRLSVIVTAPNGCITYEGYLRRDIPPAEISRFEQKEIETLYSSPLDNVRPL